MSLGLGLNLGLGRGGGANRIVRPFFNGIPDASDTFTGGPNPTLDNNGVLQPSYLDVPAVTGGRYATTVAEGAVLGDDAITNGDFSDGLAGWNKVNSAVVAGGAVTVAYSGTYSEIYQRVLTANKNYVAVVDVSAVAGTPTLKSSSGTFATFSVGTSAIPFTTGPSDANLEILAGKSGDSVTLRSIVAMPVIPQWLPTDTDGNLLYAATMVRGKPLWTDADPTQFKRYLGEPARTNYFLNSATPATQNITTTAQQYTVSVIGTGSVTLSGTATGVATEGSPLTVTATAGTLTCTVAGTLAHVQVEAGAFATSPITTAAAAVTRQATRLVIPSAGRLRGNDIAIMGQVVPGAGGQASGRLFSTMIDATAHYQVYAEGSTGIGIIKYINGATYQCIVSHTYANTPIRYQAYQSSNYGMGISISYWTGSAWSAWTSWATNADTQDAPIASTFEIGTRNGSNHFAGNYQLFRTFFTSDPKSYLEALR